MKPKKQSASEFCFVLEIMGGIISDPLAWLYFPDMCVQNTNYSRFPIWKLRAS